MRVASLGQYARHRFADFVVSDATGKRLNLLTRQQHGALLTKATLAKHFYALPEEIRHELTRAASAQSAYQALKEALYSYFTTVGAISDSELEAESMTARFKLLLTSLRVPGTTSKIDAFAKDFTQVMDTTRYLCWVEAAPGDVVNLKVTYTTADARRRLGRGTVVDRVKTLRLGLDPRRARSVVRDDWLRQFGLAPINYEFSIPSHRHAGSYYFTLDPPVGTEVTYLDWESGNSLQSDEVDCSVRSAHIHYEAGEDERDTDRGGTIRAYVRCAPSDHKLIVGTALLNAAFVILTALGRVPGKPGSAAQTILLAAPSIYVAYLARQQRHYFSDAMRRQRGIIWFYLAISVIFLVTLTFSRHEGALGSRGFGTFATGVTWLWGLASVAIAFWYLPLGGSYERVTESLAKRSFAKRPKSDGEVRVPWERYDATVGIYARGSFTLAIFAATGMLLATIVLWQHAPRHTARSSTNTVLLSVPPGALCQGCSLSLRVPPLAK
jgi:hypothetical protein